MERGWRRGGVGGVVRPVNNPLHSLRANKNANAGGEGGGVRLFDEAAQEKNADRGKTFFFFLLLPRCVRGDGTDTPKVEGLIELRRHDAESRVIHYR